MEAAVSDLDRALEDIAAIRARIAGASTFRGLGPQALALTGLLALAAAAVQTRLPVAGAPAFLGFWLATAVVAALILAAGTLARARRLHGHLALPMIVAAAEGFLPAGLAGLVLAFVLLVHAPDALWVVPGLWQVLTGLGILAALRSLPRAVGLAGLWYVAAGFGVLILAAPDRALSPWAMGLPFAIGQTLAALALRAAELRADDPS